jgi:hypothetical protein
MVDGKSFRLADEVRYIQRRAAEHDERVVSFGQIVLFSTQSGDAWLLDASDHLAARLARDGDAEPIQIEDTETTLRDRLEGSIPHRGIRIRVHGWRYRPGNHNPRLPDAETGSDGVISVDCHRPEPQKCLQELRPTRSIKI